MKTKTGTVAIIGVVLLSAAVFAQEGRKITGVVEAASGGPVANALVSYAERDRELWTTRTDSKGAFEIPDARRGVVTVTARGFGTAKRSWPPRTGLVLRFVLSSPAVVGGSLVDAATGAGVAGTVVLDARDRFYQVSKSAEVRGAFEFVDLPAGPAVVQALADGFAPHFGTLTIAAKERTDIRIGLLLQAVASGHVLEADGSPAVEAVVYVGYSSSLPGAETLAALAGGDSVTDEEGQFVIEGLVPDNSVYLQAELDGRLSEVVTVQIAPGMMRTGIVLRLGRS